MSDILVVEDSLTQAMRLKYLLEKSGRKVRVARDGMQALDELAVARPDIIITDVMMPRMNGYELCRTIKQDEAFKEIPVVIVTTLSNPVDVIKGLQCGANNFIIKPYEESYLLSRLRHLEVNIELRKNRGAEMAMEVFFAGEKHLVNSERMQIIDLLLSTFEMAVLQSQSLEVSNRELRTSLETIKALELNYRTLLEKSPDAIVACDKFNLVRFANPSAEKLFGQTVDALTGSRFDVGVSPGEDKEITITRGDGGAVVAQAWAVRTSWDGEEVCLALLRDVTDRVRLREALARAASTDPLTGLLNRRGFFDQAGVLSGQARSLGRRLSLTLFDLKGLRDVNARFGHDQGDALLADLARLLTRVYPEGAAIGRLDGDAFAVALVEGETPDLDPTAAQLFERLARHNRERPDLPAPLGVRVAGQVFAPGEAPGAQELQGLFDALSDTLDKARRHDDPKPSV